MFIVDADPQFTHPVKVRKPVDGGHREETLKATFRVIPADEMEEFDLSTADGSTAFLKRAIVELGDLVGPDKQPLSYNDALRDQLLRLNYVRVALARAYYEAISPARVGN